MRICLHMSTERLQFINLYVGVVLNPIEAALIFQEPNPVIIDDVDFNLYFSFITDGSNN